MDRGLLRAARGRRGQLSRRSLAADRFRARLGNSRLNKSNRERGLARLLEGLRNIATREALSVLDVALRINQ